MGTQRDVLTGEQDGYLQILASPCIPLKSSPPVSSPVLQYNMCCSVFFLSCPHPQWILQIPPICLPTHFSSLVLLAVHCRLARHAPLHLILNLSIYVPMSCQGCIISQSMTLSHRFRNMVCTASGSLSLLLALGLSSSLLALTLPVDCLCSAAFPAAH